MIDSCFFSELPPRLKCFQIEELTASIGILSAEEEERGPVGILSLIKADIPRPCGVDHAVDTQASINGEKTQRSDEGQGPCSHSGLPGTQRVAEEVRDQEDPRNQECDESRPVHSGTPIKDAESQEHEKEATANASEKARRIGNKFIRCSAFRHSAPS